MFCPVMMCSFSFMVSVRGGCSSGRKKKLPSHASPVQRRVDQVRPIMLFAAELAPSNRVLGLLHTPSRFPLG